MSTEIAWNSIIRNLNGKNIELPTVPKTKKVPVWFSASTDGNMIYIGKALINKPSSRLSMERKLTYKTFQKVYPFYLKRKQGESVSVEVTRLTVDQVYYYSLMHHLSKIEEEICINRWVKINNEGI